jgi:uncharacterized repeat protein (TIGR03803 family)
MASCSKRGDDSARPYGGLTDVSGTLYGAALEQRGYGSVFSITPRGRYTILHSFYGLDGARPMGALIDLGNTLYGTTKYGGNGPCDYFYSGPSGCGTVFSINRYTGGETVLYDFNCSYFCNDSGDFPQPGLTDVDGTLYGTTAAGGASNDGTVFSINLHTGTETVIYSFAGGSDGAVPNGFLKLVTGTLYGTTASGGAHGDGTVFSINPSTGTETVLHSFAGRSDGAVPNGAFTLLDGVLYGTTSQGGSH